MIKDNERIHKLPSPIMAQLDSRDAALWLAPSEVNTDEAEDASNLSKLPWNVVISDRSDAAFLAGLEGAEALDAPLVRRRGLIHLIDSDPAETLLPPRHLAVLLLNGLPGARRTGLAAVTRRLTMLQELRKRSVKQLIVVVQGAFLVPDDITELWADGYRTFLTFVSDDPAAPDIVEAWRHATGATFIDVINMSLPEFSRKLVEEYLRGRDGRLVVRMRSEQAGDRLVDATDIDDPERPILSSYELISSELLSSLLPSDLSAEEVEGFFADPSASWRPYAAGIAWERDKLAWEKLRNRLRALDRGGVEENRILYVSAESGAGVTTFLYDMAWRSADAGYPTLIARRESAAISGLEMSGFLTRLINAEASKVDGMRRYETPCVLVYDHDHWAGRDSELLSFAREIERSGRRVCIVIAVGPYTSISMLTENKFVNLADLTHQVSTEQAVVLGRHLNQFLAPHGTAKTEQEWRNFVHSSAVSGGQGIAAFWIVLSFWLQRQIDLNETVQSRIYRQFKDVVNDDELKSAVLRIAAFSTIGRGLPDQLMPDTVGWPLSARIEDMRRELGVLALLRVSNELDRFWVMAHDILGRYLLTAFFYDHAARTSLGYDEAQNPEHLRFLILKEISSVSRLQHSDMREVAESFAVSIFKVDPDHGYATLVPYWRDVLEALDQMPRAVRTTSRTFLHHGAISRRRIASDPDTFIISNIERVELLRRAVGDLQAALRLEAPPGSDTDINLYNSLAHAYHDLANAEAEAGVDSQTVLASRNAAKEATRRAYALNPDNSFVVETYARTLLSDGVSDPHVAAEKALEVLTLVYGLMERPNSEPRRNALARLSEQAFELLLEAGGAFDVDEGSEVGAIALALRSLGARGYRHYGAMLREIPRENRERAAALLAVPALAGNVQAVKLRYMLSVIDQPTAFEVQLELLEALQGGGPAFTPQMELELATLLFQMDRSHEGDRLFQRLRGMWRRGEHFVEVPQRLHWLLDATRTDRRQVRGKVITNAEGRAFARISEFQNVEVPLRAAEFGQQHLPPGTPLAGFISFGHNGPLLRPLTAPRR